jgi:hypothetical protein
MAFLTVAFAWPCAAAADPLVFFLMSAAREIAFSAVGKAYAASRAPGALPPAVTYPGTAVEPETLRRVIEDSFTYLSSSQRSEIFESLNTMLLDPKIGPTRATLIEYFLHKALAVRAAQVELGKLSYAEKERLAVQFKQETADLSEEDRRHLLSLLEQNLLPVPADLNQLLLAQLQEVR